MTLGVAVWRDSIYFSESNLIRSTFWVQNQTLAPENCRLPYGLKTYLSSTTSRGFFFEEPTVHVSKTAQGPWVVGKGISGYEKGSQMLDQFHALSPKSQLIPQNQDPSIFAKGLPIAAHEHILSPKRGASRPPSFLTLERSPCISMMDLMKTVTPWTGKGEEMPWG